ncbi:MAG TPA: AMP-binding protein, partial [Acidimicrobiia bacterium]
MTRAHHAPGALQARWRARGIWTDETLPDRLGAVEGETIAIVDGDVRLTVDELRVRSSRLAAALRDRGIGPGQVVAWQLPNWWEAVVVCWAVWRCGATASPITTTLGAREVGHILSRTGARLIVTP